MQQGEELLVVEEEEEEEEEEDTKGLKRPRTIPDEDLLGKILTPNNLILKDHPTATIIIELLDEEEEEK
ncbi:hypothetical protein H4Q26_014744 [Puccinia striiformis f. sp. tritici PST-130]|nr:hypothetical protein H4Q26_014744 [Puccinia striiformis f. sp. tritici PST-130]